MSYEILFHSKKGKKPEMMNFVGKWLELEKFILCEGTQTQKDKPHHLSSELPRSKSSDVSK